MLMKMRGQMQKGHNQKGFTLVELMVVVVIIGVLVAIAVPVYSNVTTKAEKSAVEANLRTIDSAIMTYYATVDSPKDLKTVGIGELVAENLLADDPSVTEKITYSITGDKPNQRASFTGTVGGKNYSTPQSLPVSWQ